MLGNSLFWLYALRFLSNNSNNKKGRWKGRAKGIKGYPKERYDFSFFFYSSSLKEGNLSSSAKWGGTCSGSGRFGVVGAPPQRLRNILLCRHRGNVLCHSRQSGRAGRRQGIWDIPWESNPPSYLCMIYAPAQLHPPLLHCALIHAVGSMQLLIQ